MTNRFFKHRTADRISPVQGQYLVLQPKETDRMEQRSFLGLDSMKRLGFIHGTEDILPEDYDHVYSGSLPDLPERSVQETLEDIYLWLNTRRPAGFIGHSLSVGDVILLVQEEGTTAWFVDSLGFKELPEFAAEMISVSGQKESVEEDYGRE